MIIVKIVFIILLAGPVVLLAGFLYRKARDYAVEMNRSEKKTARSRRSDF